MLRDAEERLGLPLFERRGRATDSHAVSAEALFAEIERSFIGLESINSLASRLHQNQRKALSVVCTPAFGASVLPAITSRFAQHSHKTLLSVHSWLHTIWLLRW